MCSPHPVTTAASDLKLASAASNFSIDSILGKGRTEPGQEEASEAEDVEVDEDEEDTDTESIVDNDLPDPIFLNYLPKVGPLPGPGAGSLAGPLQPRPDPSLLLKAPFLLPDPLTPQLGHAHQPAPSNLLYPPWLSASSTVKPPPIFFGLQGNTFKVYYNILIHSMFLPAPKPIGRRARKPGVDRKPRQAYSAKQLDQLEAEFKVCIQPDMLS